MWNNRVLEKTEVRGGAAEGNLIEKRAPVNIFHICSSLKLELFCPHESVTHQAHLQEGHLAFTQGPLSVSIAELRVYNPSRGKTLLYLPFHHEESPHEQTTASSCPRCGPAHSNPSPGGLASSSLGLGSQVCPHRSALKVSIKGQASALGNVHATHPLAKVMLNNILPQLVKIQDS